MKIIFLDIEGVLTSEASLLKNKGVKDEHAWDSNCVEELERVLSETKANVVIASHHGVNHPNETLRGFRLFSLRRPIGFVEQGKHVPTGTLVQEYLDIHDVESYVIINDNADRIPAKMNSQFIQPQTAFGLTKPFADKAIEILNKK